LNASAVVENDEAEQRELHSSCEIKNLTLMRLSDVFKCVVSAGSVRRRGTFRDLFWYRGDKFPLLSGFGPTRQKVERIRIVYSH
jgi:hypothetical protein